MKIIKKKKRTGHTPEMNMDGKKTDDKLEIRHLKTDYPVSDDRINQLASNRKRLVPCNISADEDHYIFTYDTENLQSFDSVRNARLIDKYEFLLNAGDLADLTAIFSFSLSPDNLLIDAAFRPNVIDRNFSLNKNNFLEEYKALIGATLDDEHSYEDFLRGGADLFSQSDILVKVMNAESVSEVIRAVLEAAAGERKYEKENFVTVKKSDITRNKRLLPIIGFVMILAILFSGYEYFVKGNTTGKIITATEQYFTKDYGSVGKTLASFDEVKMSDSTRYMAAVSAVKSSGLTAAQKDNVLKAIERYRTNKDYLNYWVMIGRQDYIAADDYAQKIGDKEHRVFALALRKAQVSKDVSISGSKKTETINSLDEKIKKLLDEINEDRDGLSNDGDAEKKEPEMNTKSGKKADSKENNGNNAKNNDEPKLLN